MSLLPLVGHNDSQHDVRRAIVSNRMPQALLVTGPRGIGKQRFALWVAQALLCSGNGQKPCGACRECLQVLGLTHPDLHWFVPVPRPKAGDADRQMDEVAEALESVMAERRHMPAWGPPDGMAIHGIASARLLQREASLTSVAGGWRVFVVGHAERLVPQESSPEAANALLKLLEEPPARAVFVLTTAEPGLVLPTIRSRMTPVRLGRLGSEETAEVVRRAKPDGEPKAASPDKAREAARGFLAALDRGSTITERVLRQGPWQARGEFTDMLDALAAELSSRSRRAAGQPDRVSRQSSRAIAAGIGCVLQARERAQGNVNPQLLLAVLAEDLVESGVASD